MTEEKLEKEISALRELAAKDKKIDVASLMINAIQKQDQNSLSSKEKRWAYLTSLLFPPFGLIFCVKFYFSGKDDGESAAWTCGLLTAVSILFFILFLKVLISSSGLSSQQLQDLPNQYQQLLE